MAEAKKPQALGCGGLFLLALLFTAAKRSCGGDDVDGKNSTAKYTGGVLSAAAAGPAPTPRATVADEPQAPDPNRPALSGSRAAFRGWFRKLGLEFERSPLADGTPREMATSGTLIVETIGYGDRLERASVTMGLVQGDMEGTIKATGAMMVFMRETGWEKGASWVTTTMQKPSGAGKTDKNGTHYELIKIMDGMYNLSAKPVAAVGKP
jgi:hypothetical protein